MEKVLVTGIASGLGRLVGRLLRNSTLNRPMPSGLKIPKKFTFLQPDPDVTWDEATTHLERAVQRVESGERMTHPSPVLGPLEHEEWMQLQCRHAEMHFGFLEGAQECVANE